MEKIAKFTGQKMTWTRLKDSQKYELRSDADLIATMWVGAFEKFSATATSADGCWTFMRAESDLHDSQPPIEIHDFEMRKRIAVYLPDRWKIIGNGRLVLADGKEFKAVSNFWGTRYEFQMIGGKSLFIFRRRGGFSSEVEIQLSAGDVPELPWMVMLGWYMKVRQCFDPHIQVNAG